MALHDFERMTDRDLEAVLDGEMERRDYQMEIAAWMVTWLVNSLTPRKLKQAVNMTTLVPGLVARREARAKKGD